MAIYEAFEFLGFNPELVLDADDSVNLELYTKRITLLDWKNSALNFLLIQDIDILIVDSYKIDKQNLLLLSEHTSTSVFIDDNNRLDYPAGIIVNGSINGRDLFHSKNPTSQYLLGSKYTPLRNPFWENQPKTIKSKVENILISLGGFDAKDLTLKIVTLIDKSFSNIKIKVVYGRESNKSKLGKIKKSNLEIIENADALLMKKLMVEADLAISNAGQTIYELAAIGTPTIAIVVADNQRNNLNGWINEGFLLEKLIWNDNTIEFKILNLIQLLLDESLRKKISFIGQSRIDGKGAINLAKVAIKNNYVKSIMLRKANSEDLGRVFQLANEIEVRKNSFSMQPITLEEHTIWFNQKITSGNSNYYIAEINNDFVGQIRFDLDQEVATISISINSEFRGYGLGKKMIELGISLFNSDRPNIKNINAEIKKENYKSLKIFLANNFIVDQTSSNPEKYVLNYRYHEII